MAQFSRTWWGQRFLAALERFTDPARLGRGRSYARGGKVLQYGLDGSKVTAKVRGSINPYFGVYKEPIYSITISLTPIAPSGWSKVIADLSGKAGFVARLLMNEMPDSIDEAFASLGTPLLPSRESDFTTHCSCPDWANPCKHIAGVYYLLAADLDRDPFLLFELRGLSRQKLRSQLATSPLGQILAKELAAQPEVAIEADEAYFTVPAVQPAECATLKEFWTGSRRLPAFEPAPAPRVPGPTIKKQGDYPPFWNKDASFIEVLDELYDRVRSKSQQLK